MNIISINSGSYQDGATVETYEFKNNGQKIPILSVGEEGRGRKRGFIVVNLLPKEYSEWKEGKHVNIFFASLAKTAAGGYKLQQTATNTDDIEKGFIAVFNTKIGFRGSNNHTGDRIELQDVEKGFYPFPATETLIEGRIAQGDAGGMGSGEQMICVMPFNVVFRTAYGGRLYGSPSSHYYLPTINKEGKLEIEIATFDERVATDIF